MMGSKEFGNGMMSDLDRQGFVSVRPQFINVGWVLAEEEGVLLFMSQAFESFNACNCI